MKRKRKRASGTAPVRHLRYQLRITLLGIEPPVWRLVEVPGPLALGELHDVIQIAMGWYDEHLHAFVTSLKGRGTRYEPRWYRQWDGFRHQYDGVDEDAVSVAEVFRREGSKLYYRYDFGDDWVHELRLVKRVPATEEELWVRCLDGQRACPPEDCGGAWSYMRAVEVLKSGPPREAEELREWYGDFDPERFDLEAVQAFLL